MVVVAELETLKARLTKAEGVGGGTADAFGTGGECAHSCGTISEYANEGNIDDGNDNGNDNDDGGGRKG